VAHLRPGDPDPEPGLGPGSGDGKSRRDRAQLLLLAGFALAAVFVAFAFLLNSVIYTENLATRGEGSRATHAIAVTNDAATGTEAVIGYANEHNTTDYTSLESELVSGIGDVERLVGAQQLADSGVLSVSYVSHRRGTWINQSDNSRNFTDRNFDEDWMLFTDADGARALRIHVTNPDDLQDIDTVITPIENFTVTATDGTEVWQMEVYHDNGGVLGLPIGDSYVAEVTDADGNTRYCSVDDGVDSFWINVSAGTFAGEECRALRFGEGVPTVERVDFDHGGNINGTYRLMAAKDQGAITVPYNSTGSPPPVTTPAIYNATIRVSYDTESLHYETERAAEPEERDE
jgi:hypothetical protein